MSEVELQRAIITALTQLGVWAIRIGSVGRRSTRGANSGEPGIPDIYIPRYNGWMEVKTPTGRVSPEQEAWHAKAKANGVFVQVVRSVEEAVTVIRAWHSLLEPMMSQLPPRSDWSVVKNNRPS